MEVKVQGRHKVELAKEVGEKWDCHFSPQTKIVFYEFL